LGGSATDCRVGNLAHEVGIGVPIADAAQRSASRGDSTATDAEQGLVREDVPPGEQAEFLTGQDLAPGPADGQEHLTHIDLGAEAVVDAATALHFGREAEVDAEVG